MKYLKYRKEVVQLKMGDKLDEYSNGFNFGDRTFMVAGYLKDFILTYGPAISISGKRLLTASDFKENRGYVDENGYIHIYRENPDKNELIPWFTTEFGADGFPVLKMNKRRSKETREAFRIERVGDLSIAHINKVTTDAPIEYDAEVSQDLARSTSNYIPEIKENDDFLKKVIKKAILEKEVNLNKYKATMNKTWTLPNLIQALFKDTKISPTAFVSWMEILDCDFELIIRDNGCDRDNPLPRAMAFNSLDGRIHAKMEGGNKDAIESSLKSTKQFD